jgi:hypothetical protein
MSHFDDPSSTGFRPVLADALAAAAPSGDAVVSTLAAAVRYVAEPADDAEIEVGASKVGGEPDLPEGTAWPRWTRRDGTSQPLQFYAQFNLAEAARVAPGDLGLPSDGVLSLFADVDTDGNGGAIGLYPSEAPASTLIHSPADVRLRRTAAPVDVLASSRLRGIGIWTWDADALVADSEIEAVWELADRYEAAVRDAAGLRPGGASHQLGGRPNHIQHPVLTEVVQAVNGCFTDRGFDGALWDRVRGQVDDWRVVAQIDSDPMAKLWFGDAGMVSWALRCDDVAHRRWSESMLNFQCH